MPGVATPPANHSRLRSRYAGGRDDALFHLMCGPPSVCTAGVALQLDGAGKAEQRMGCGISSGGWASPGGRATW
ncbi:hypothetical protein SBV1_880003 [Verrucomicrobia bacterium]|nr:hypothetical protein SBV1_880003 [Verrucomicrobiota bacterium]